MEDQLKQCILTHESLVEFNGDELPESAPCPSTESRDHWLGRLNEMEAHSHFEFVGLDTGLLHNHVKLVVRNSLRNRFSNAMSSSTAI